MTTTSPRFVVLFGAQGSGKGTQARLLQDEFGLPQIATGDLFRYNLKNETELGQLAKSYMDRGELVPDDVTNAMVQERLGRDDCRGGAVFDGYPRNIAQAHALDAMLDALGAEVHCAVSIEVSHRELMRRLMGRRVCRQCQASYHIEFNPPAEAGTCDRCGGEVYQRDDDRNEAALARRLEIYAAETLPVVTYYRERGRLVTLDGERDITEVQGALREAIA